MNNISLPIIFLVLAVVVLVFFASEASITCLTSVFVHFVLYFICF